MTKNKKKVFRITLICTAVVLTVVVIFGGVCLALMSQDNISTMYTMTEEDDSFLGTLLRGAMVGKEFELTETQVNTYLNKTFCAEDKPLKKIRVYFHKNEPVEIYARVFRFGAERAMYAKAQIDLLPEEGRTAVRITDVKLGELHVHSHVVDNMLRDFAKSTPLAEFENGVLYIKTEYSYEGRNFSLMLRLEKLEPADRVVLCKTNSLTSEVISAIRDYLLSDDGQDFFKHIFGDKINDIKNFILRFLF
ncbi:MAG: hypothetical protein IJU51_08450 [Clostridia bacterium]|nr:hypothetical protein [Clostridia bacterium]